MLTLVLLGGVAAAAVMDGRVQLGLPKQREAGLAEKPALPIQRCDIKGNVSQNSGERIYHVPGQLDYDDTRIDPLYGERWFCSESDALAAGWRRAGR